MFFSPRRHPPAFAALCLMGCTSWDVAPAGGACGTEGETKGAVVTDITFARTFEDGTADGIDLDGRVSDAGDGDGCFKEDFVSPDGRPGIDNQLGTLLPLVEELVGSENIDALLDGAIANGQLLIMIALSNVDDPQNDDCVDVRVGAGLGTPFLDADGAYEPYQTFGFDEERAETSTLVAGRIAGGVLEAGPGRVNLPVQILDASFNLDMRFSRVRLEVQHDALGGGVALRGFIGGGILVDDFSQVVSGLNIGDDIVGAVVPLLRPLADLEIDPEEGICRRVSGAFQFESTPAFLYE